MSLLNKYMHPRNIYRIPPNFKDLAISYPEFRSYAKQDLSGKIVIDFKDQATLRALTTTLLKKDFDLNVEIPLDRLVPTLPLRLNYLLWVEDLLLLLRKESTEDLPVCGIDVGTGSACIYSLLAAKTNKWHMLATEVDTKNAVCAQKNVECNNLQDLVTVKHVGAGTVLAGAVDAEVTYDFCMCNPPFFSNEEDLDLCAKSRSATRHVPHNARTGALGELVVEGGEVSFVSQMIKESQELNTKIRIYTTMVGQKSSLSPLKTELTKLGVAHATTEFCQGHTTRWGLAWTFINNLQLATVVPTVSRKQHKKKPPLKYIVPKTCSLPEYTVACTSVKLQELLLQLKMDCKEVVNDKHMTSYCATAYEDTWSNQRRKRRQEKKVCPADDSKELCVSAESKIMEETHSTMPETDAPSTKRRLQTADECTEEMSKRRRIALDEGSDNETAHTSNLVIPPLLKIMIAVRKVSSEINIELSWLEGTSGRDVLHQVLQYVKNNLK